MAWVETAAGLGPHCMVSAGSRSAGDVPAREGEGRGGWEGWCSNAVVRPTMQPCLPHLQGQSLVSPTAAQIVFCSVPLWSALTAAAVLPGEPVGWATWVGGALVAAAGLLAGIAQRRPGGR